MNSLQYLLFLRLIDLIIGVASLQNITVYDQSSLITYTPRVSWYQPENSSYDASGSHMLTSDPNAFATFTFTGVGIYFMAPMWPYPVSSSVQLDDGPVVILDLEDHSRATTGGGGPATIMSQVIAKATGLENDAHTLRISVGDGQIFAIVDALIYTSVLKGETVPSSSSTPPNKLTPVSVQSNSSSATQSALPKTSKVVQLGVILSILSLNLVIIFGIFVWCWCSRRMKRSNENTFSPFLVPTSEVHLPITPNLSEVDDEELLTPLSLHVSLPPKAYAQPVISRRPAHASLPPSSSPAPLPPSVVPRTSNYSPRTYAQAIRGVLYSPTRAYPVRPLNSPDLNEGERTVAGDSDLDRDSAQLGSSPLLYMPHPQPAVRKLRTEGLNRAHRGRMDEQWMSSEDNQLAYVPLFK